MARRNGWSIATIRNTASRDKKRAIHVVAAHSMGEGSKSTIVQCYQTVVVTSKRLTDEFGFITSKRALSAGSYNN